MRTQQTHHIPSFSPSPLSGDIDPAGSVLLGCALQRCWDCQRKYTVPVWNPGVPRKSVKFGHYSCNSAFMFHSQGVMCAAATAGLCGKRGLQRETYAPVVRRIVSKTASSVHEECWTSGRHPTAPAAGVKDLMRTTINPGCENMTIR